jgi:hypothetical protein
MSYGDHIEKVAVGNPETRPLLINQRELEGRAAQRLGIEGDNDGARRIFMQSPLPKLNSLRQRQFS